MPIPKVIYQTYRSNQLPWITRFHIFNLKRKNPDYDYQFYDDARIDAFIKSEFDEDTYKIYKRIAIGAAKADFFRYAILYKKGGIYLDIDSLIKEKLAIFIKESDSAIISLESNLENYCQYALFFEANHPFLKKTIEIMLDNLKNNKFPKDVHKMTGPSIYFDAIKSCIQENNNVLYRQTGIDYDLKVTFSYPMSKFFLYGLSRKNHWKTQIKTKFVLSEE